MRILFISQYFPPEMGAPAARVHELARRWAARGHDVTVLTGFPNHPTGIVRPEYRGRWVMRESRDGIHVVRTFLYATPNRAVVKRSVAYVSFMLSAALAGPFVTRRPDVVLATSPQFLVGLAGWIVAAVKRRPFVLEVRDLWPDSIVAVGALPEAHLVVRLLRRLERFLYRRARAVVVVTRSFVGELAARGVPPCRIKVVTNGVDLALFGRLVDRANVRRRLGFENRFVCSYVGTVGMAHGLETILDAAEILRGKAPDVVFAIVGEGARRADVEAEAVRRGLDNVVFLGQRPREEVPDLLAASDVAIILLRASPLFRTVLPSKMFEAMGSATPVILGVEGEAADRLREAGAGVPIRPQDPAALAEAVLALRADPEHARALGVAGRRAAIRDYDRDALADDYAAWLEDLFGTGPG